MDESEMNLDGPDSREKTGIHCRTDLTIEELHKKFEQLNFALKKT